MIADTRHREPAVDDCLDLEAVAPDHRVRAGGGLGVVGQVQQRDQVGPEGVVAVAQVGEPGPEPHVEQRAEHPVAEVPHRRDVRRTATRGVARALGEVGPRLERVDVASDLGRVGRTVGVEHDDDVAGDPGESRGHRVALALACLEHRDDVWHRPAGGADRAVDRATVNEDHLMHLRQLRQHGGEVERLVERRNDDADARINGVATPGHGAGSPLVAAHVGSHPFCCSAPRRVPFDTRNSRSPQPVARGVKSAHGAVTFRLFPQVTAVFGAGFSGSGRTFRRAIVDVGRRL